MGIHLTATEYIAFLNHDDIWLADHLETAITTMREKSADFFLGNAVTCHSKHQEFFKNQDRLYFSELNNPRAIWRCIYGPNEFFEPVSAWVIKTKLAKKVGYWFAPDKALKTPLMDWLARAARTEANFTYSNKVTTLKFNLHPFFTKTYLLKLIYTLRLDNILGHSIINIMLRIENKLIIWFSYLMFSLKVINNKSKDIRQQSKYLNKEIDLDKVKYYLELDPCAAREFIIRDIDEAYQKKLLDKNKSVKSLKNNKGEQRRIISFNRYIATGIIDQKQKNKMIYTSKFFRSLVYDRTGEMINTFIPPETVIDELIQRNII